MCFLSNLFKKTCISEFTNETLESRERITRTFIFVLKAVGQIHKAILFYGVKIQ